MKHGATALAHAPAGGAPEDAGRTTAPGEAWGWDARGEWPSLASASYRPPPARSGPVPRAARGAREYARAAELAKVATPRPPPLRRPEWCVDDRGTIRSMTLLELWTAVASGAIGRRARAWRLGMECWTPVEEIEELAAAATRAPSQPEDDRKGDDGFEEIGEDALVELTPEPGLSAGTRALPEVEVEVEVTRDALTPPAPAGEIAPPAPPGGEAGRALLESVPQQAEALVVAAADVWRLERGKLWVAVGSLAASLALVLAPTLASRGATVRAASELERQAETSTAEEAPPPAPHADRAPAEAAPAVPAEVVPALALPDAPGLRAAPPPAPPAPRAEVGQRRLRARSFSAPRLP